MMEFNSTYLNHPVFVTGNATSGTTLLRNLLDSHPGLIVFPVEMNLRTFINKGGSLKKDFDIEKFFSTGPTTGVYSLRHDSMLPVDGMSHYDGFNFSLFKQQVREKWDGKTAKSLQIEVIQSFVEHSHYKLHPANPKMWVEKTHGNEHYLKVFFQWYPNAKIIHTVRDPFDNFASYRVKSEKKGGIVTPVSFCVQWSSSMRHVLNFKKKKPDQILIIKYEKLLERPDDHLEKICNFLEIPFDPVLKTPTGYGMKWSGNSQQGMKLEGISKRPIGSHKSRVSKSEIDSINFPLSKYRSFFYWNYPQAAMDLLRNLSLRDFITLLTVRTATYEGLKKLLHRSKSSN